MQTYVLMTKLSPDMSKDVDHRTQLGRAWMQQVKEKCPEVKFLGHYTILGPWDYIDIFEAPNEEVAAKVSMITQSCGASWAESWTAIPYKRFAELMKELEE